MSSEFVLLYWPESSQESALIKMILEREQIPCFIKNEGYFNPILTSSRVVTLELYVPEAYAEKTVKLFQTELHE